MTKEGPETLSIVKDIFLGRSYNAVDTPEERERVVNLAGGTRHVRPLKDFVHYIECEYCGSRMSPERYDCSDCGAPLPLRKTWHRIQQQLRRR